MEHIEIVTGEQRCHFQKTTAQNVKSRLHPIAEVGY